MPGPAVLFARCRFALFEGLRLLARERGLRRVWLPAWICRPVPEAVQAAGLGVALYDIDECLAPRLETVAPAAGDGLLVVHYFGLAQPLARLRAFCDAHGLALIEDAAHALPDPGSPERIGAAGDVAVFSLRKQLPVAGGGLLVVRDERLRLEGRPPASCTWGDTRELAKLVLMAAERLAFTLGVNILPLKNRLPVADGAPLAAADLAGEYLDPPAPSRLVAPMLGGLDWTALITARRDGYARLAGALRDIPGIRVALAEAPGGSVPLAVPLWSPRADALARALRRRGVEATCWPWGEQAAFSPRAFPGATAWLTRSVFLPLTTPLSARSLPRLVRTVRAAAPEAV